MDINNVNMNRFTNVLPPAGGATGAIMESTLQFSSISQTIILAAIGAIVGWCIKVMLDELWEKHKKKHRTVKKQDNGKVF